jgi:hypothetical protein
MFEHPRHRTGDARPTASLALVLTRFIGVFGAPAGALLGFAFSWRWKSDARTPGFGQANRNHLLRRSRSVFAAANLVDLIAHELPRLRRWSFARTLRSLSLLDYTFFRHKSLPPATSGVAAWMSAFISTRLLAKLIRRGYRAAQVLYQTEANKVIHRVDVSWVESVMQKSENPRIVGSLIQNDIRCVDGLLHRCIY